MNIGSCPVCGVAVSILPQKNCQECNTSHCIECWEHIGGCAIFGCKNQANKSNIVKIVNAREIVESPTFSNSFMNHALALGFMLGDVVTSICKFFKFYLPHYILLFLPFEMPEEYVKCQFFTRQIAGIIESFICAGLSGYCFILYFRYGNGGYYFIAALLFSLTFLNILIFEDSTHYLPLKDNNLPKLDILKPGPILVDTFLICLIIIFTSFYNSVIFLHNGVRNYKNRLLDEVMVYRIKRLGERK